MHRGLLAFGAASLAAALLIAGARRVLRDSPKGKAWATGAILGGACFAASLLSFTTPPTAFDGFGVSVISLGFALSWVRGELRLAADTRASNEPSVLVFKLSGDEEADLRRSVEIMAGLVDRLRARGLACSDAAALKPWGAGFECGSFAAALDFGPSPGTLAIELRGKISSMEEARRILGEALAADDRVRDRSWMSPAERHRLARESS